MLVYFYPIVIITKIYLGYISDMALRLRLLEIYGGQGWTISSFNIDFQIHPQFPT